MQSNKALVSMSLNQKPPNFTQIIAPGTVQQTGSFTTTSAMHQPPMINGFMKQNTGTMEGAPGSFLSE